MGSVRVAIVGVGNCAASLVQGVDYYADADPDRAVPGLMHVQLRRLPRLATSSSSPRSTSTPRRSAATCPRPSSPARTTPSRSPTCRRSASPCSAATPSTASASTTARPSRSPTSSRSTWSPRCASPAPTSWSATCRSAPQHAAEFYAQCAIDAGVAFVNAPPGLHRRHQGVGGQVHRRRRADRRRRHQEPGRRHHHPPGAGQAVRGPRRAARPHDAAQRRRQHGLQEHARARAAGVQEDLQDPVGHQPDRPRHGQGQRAHRPVGPRAVARRTASGPTSGSRAARSATSR